ncbi:MAG: hypothetical protein ACXU80_11530 [Xanthobacteraceae bacterium]
MAMHHYTFKRLVLGFQSRIPERSSMRLAAELASLLDLELLGLFLEDSSLRDLAAIPFAREIRSLGGGWHRLDTEQLSHDLDLAARNAERTFSEVAKRLQIKCQFEVVRGATTKSIAALSRTDDIVMVAEPTSAAERATGQFQWLVDAAFRSAAAVLLVPTRIVRNTGPVVAIAAAAEDPSLYVAALIANGAREKLVILDVDRIGADDPGIKELAVGLGLTIEHINATGIQLSDADTCAQAFHGLQERLVVITTNAMAHHVATSIASSRHVPVLVIEPAEMTPNGGRRQA